MKVKILLITSSPPINILRSLADESISEYKMRMSRI